MLRKRVQAYMDFVREIQEAKLSRREMIKLGLMSAGGVFLAKSKFLGEAYAQSNPIPLPPSPPTTPFVEPLPIPPVKQPWPQLSPAPTKEPNVKGLEVRAAPHQAWDRFPPVKYYTMWMLETMHSFHPQLPPSPIWGFDGKFPGPTIHARYGEPILLRIRNSLPINHVGFGVPEAATHLHNAHTPWESDGGPFVWYHPGQYADHHFPNVHAGFSDHSSVPSEFRDPVDGGDVRQTLTTLWYHNHRPDFTAPNTYKGLIGMYLLFDERDSGDETDPRPGAYRLPSGIHDIPLVFADKTFDPQGRLFFDNFNFDGVLGDKETVNGKIQPFLWVRRRKYRFRLLNPGPARFYEFFLSNGASFIQLTNDGNFLPQPLTVQSVRLAPAERADIVVDFSQLTAGDEIFLVNRLMQVDGRGPERDFRLVSPGTPLLKFRVWGGRIPDPSQVPSFTLPVPDRAELIKDASKNPPRVWRFDRTNGAWSINGQFFNPWQSRAEIKKGSAEIWVLQNGPSWMHPIHIHLEEFLILSRNGVAPSPHEWGRKDIVNLGRDEEVRIAMRFRDFTGPYPMHCHNITHEDHAMMLRFDIV